MIEQHLDVPDLDDCADCDGYNNVLDYIKGAILSEYRGKEVRIIVRAVKKRDTP